MIKKKIYKYRTDKGVVITPNIPKDIAYTLMFRLISIDDFHLISNGEVFVKSIDVNENDLHLWYEVHKEDLSTPVLQNKDIQNYMNDLRIIEDEQDSIIIELATELAILQLTM